MPTLADLKARFVRQTPTGFASVEQLDEADGLLFLCPKCFVEDKPRHGMHSVLCWFVGKVSADALPGPGRWDPSGTAIDDLTLSPSVDLSKSGAGCLWHGWVKHGKAE